MPKIAKNRKSRKSAMKKSAKNKLALRRSTKKMKRKSRRGGLGAESGTPSAPPKSTGAPQTGPHSQPRNSQYTINNIAPGFPAHFGNLNPDILRGMNEAMNQQQNRGGRHNRRN